MGLTAIFAVNGALVRGFFVHDTYCGGIPMFFVLRLGLCALFSSRSSLRRFWVGFELAGSAAVLVLFSGDFFPDSALNRLQRAYIAIPSDLAFRQVRASCPADFWSKFGGCSLPSPISCQS